MRADSDRAARAPASLATSNEAAVWSPATPASGRAFRITRIRQSGPALLLIVHRDNAETDDLRARNAS